MCACVRVCVCACVCLACESLSLHLAKSALHAAQQQLDSCRIKLKWMQSECKVNAVWMHLRFLAKTLGLHNGLKALVAADDDLLSSCSCMNSPSPLVTFRVLGALTCAYRIAIQFEIQIPANSPKLFVEQFGNKSGTCARNVNPTMNTFWLIHANFLRRSDEGEGVVGPSVELCISTACEEIKSQVINEFG